MESIMNYSRMVAQNLGKQALFHAQMAYLEYLRTANLEGVTGDDYLKLVEAQDTMNVDFKWGED